MDRPSDSSVPWCSGLRREQWLVLVIASLGWVFDVFEGQIYVASKNEAIPALLPVTERGNASFCDNVPLAAFLLGGAVGGVFFGRLSARLGRSRTLVYTILVYSLFSGLSALSQ